MSPGAIIAVLAWGILLVLVLWGLSFDVRRWWARRRQERRLREMLALADSEWRMAEWDRKMTPWRFEWQAAELRHLPEIEPKREVRR